MRASTRTRKARERDGARHQAVASLATSPDHLRDCADASRTRSLLLSDIPLAWQGQPLRSFERLATGETFTVGANKTLTVIDLERSQATERTKDFDRTVHLRGISGRTFNLMIGATKVESRFPESERAFGCVTHSPSDGERYSEKTLIRTRKGKKLVQRPNKQRSIEIPSRYQAEQARQSHGIDFDYRALAETSERIPIQQPSKGYFRRDEAHAGDTIKVATPSYQVQGATLAQIERANPTDEDLRRAHRAEPPAHLPLDVPQRSMGPIVGPYSRLDNGRTIYPRIRPVTSAEVTGKSK